MNQSPLTRVFKSVRYNNNNILTPAVGTTDGEKEKAFSYIFVVVMICLLCYFYSSVGRSYQKLTNHYELKLDWG